MRANNEMLLTILTLLEYLLIGAVAGTFAGLRFGVGGTVIVVPALVWVFSYQTAIPADSLMHFVVGTSLAATIATTLFSLRAQHRNAVVSWGLFLKLFPASCFRCDRRYHFSELFA